MKTSASSKPTSTSEAEKFSLPGNFFLRWGMDDHLAIRHLSSKAAVRYMIAKYTFLSAAAGTFACLVPEVEIKVGCGLMAKVWKSNAELLKSLPEAQGAWSDKTLEQFDRAGNKAGEAVNRRAERYAAAPA